MQADSIGKDYSTRAAHKLINLAMLRPPKESSSFEFNLRQISRRQHQQDEPPQEPKSLWAQVQESLDVPLCDASLTEHEQAEDDGNPGKRERRQQRDILALMAHTSKWRNELEKTLQMAASPNATTLRADREQLMNKIDSIKIMIGIAS